MTISIICTDYHNYFHQSEKLLLDDQTRRIFPPIRAFPARLDWRIVSTNHRYLLQSVRRSRLFEPTRAHVTFPAGPWTNQRSSFRWEFQSERQLTWLPRSRPVLDPSFHFHHSTMELLFGLSLPYFVIPHSSLLQRWTQHELQCDITTVVFFTLYCSALVHSCGILWVPVFYWHFSVYYWKC